MVGMLAGPSRCPTCQEKLQPNIFWEQIAELQGPSGLLRRASVKRGPASNYERVPFRLRPK